MDPWEGSRAFVYIISSAVKFSSILHQMYLVLETVGIAFKNRLLVSK
jgi:hypothetical protein